MKAGNRFLGGTRKGGYGIVARAAHRTQETDGHTI